MGGQVSEVSDATTRVLMEAATWVGPNIMRTARDLALRTEASARFEKGLHPELAMAAQRLAAKLMVELCGARLVPGTLDAYPRPAAPRRAGLRLERIESLLGAVVPEDEVRAILARLGFTVEGDRRREERAAARPERVGGTHVRLEVTVPPWREGDVQREADLIEEVARIHGLGRLPSTLPARTAAGNLSLAQRLRRRLEDALRDRGLFEVASYSFTSEAALARLRLDPGDALRISNPLSEEGRVLRPLLLPGLLEAARHNAAHGRAALALFESAHVYAHSSDATAGASGVREVERRVPVARIGSNGVGSGGVAREGSPRSPRGVRPAREHHAIGAFFTEAAPGTWRSEGRPADFFAAKAVVEALLEVARLDWRAEPATHPFLHAGRSARIISSGGRELGWIGELHPLVARDWEVPAAAAFELDADALAELGAAVASPRYRDLTSFPAVVQDIAVTVPDDVSAAAVDGAVRAGSGDLLSAVRIFDVYRGDQIEEGRKSLALRLEFRAPDRTLTDEEVAGRRAEIELSLAVIGGSLRA